MVPKALGSLNVQSISYNISFDSFKDSSGAASPAVEGTIMLNVRGPRLNNTMQEKNSVMYGTDRRLFIDIQPIMPKIKVQYDLCY